MWTLPDTPDVLISFGTLLAGSAALWGAFTAHRGLGAWKEQSKWQADQELSKSLLVALFVRHDAVKSLRNPFGSMSQEALTDPQIRWNELKEDYRSRLSKLEDARRGFYPLDHEGDAQWGTQFTELSSPLSSLEAELNVEVEEYVASKNPDHKPSGYWPSRDEESANRAIVIMRNPDRDAFGQKYQTAVTSLEEFLRSKLGYHPS